MTRLFALVAPRLEVLTVLQSAAVPLPFIRCTLPALRELALLEDDRMFLRLANDYGANSRVGIPHEPSNMYFYGAGMPPDLDGWAEARPFPALETLHIVYGIGMSKVQPWSATILIWATLAPRLKYLRIDNASRRAITTVYGAVNARPRTKFRHLRTVTMQTGSPRAEDDLAYVTSPPPREGHRRRRPQVTLVGRPPFAEVTESIWRQRIVVEWYRKLPGRRDSYP
ncbi:hypothetical protein C8Q79DRAFT_1011651 [Trametes meyenii]|nr:hypothetical protein C8Q79DRAFT_1011651 [Trametes meyenii]